MPVLRAELRAVRAWPDTSVGVNSSTRGTAGRTACHPAPPSPPQQRVTAALAVTGETTSGPGSGEWCRSCISLGITPEGRADLSASAGDPAGCGAVRTGPVELFACPGEWGVALVCRPLRGSGVGALRVVAVSADVVSRARLGEGAAPTSVACLLAEAYRRARTAGLVSESSTS